MRFFHRYNSTLHGNYRKAYLRCGTVTGLLLALYIVIRWLMGTPVASPEGYVSDAVMLVALFLFAVYYRNALPEKKVTLKELMLFGMGTAVVASVVYALLLWVFCLAVPEQTALFVETMTGEEMGVEDPQLRYWAGAWALVTGIKMALLGAFGAFIAAIVFKTEKPEVRIKNKNLESKI